MSWNYRVVEIGDEGWGEPPTFGIFEVYYDEEAKPVSRTLRPLVCFETKQECVAALRRMNDALNQPTLPADTFEESQNE